MHKPTKSNKVGLVREWINTSRHRGYIKTEDKIPMEFMLVKFSDLVVNLIGVVVSLELLCCYLFVSVVVWEVRKQRNEVEFRSVIYWCYGVVLRAENGGFFYGVLNGFFGAILGWWQGDFWGVFDELCGWFLEETWWCEGWCLVSFSRDDFAGFCAVIAWKKGGKEGDPGVEEMAGWGSGKKERKWWRVLDLPDSC